MRLTPLHGPPALPSTISCSGPPRKKEKKSKSGSRAALAHKQKGRGECRVLFVFHQVVSNPNAVAHRHRETVGGGAVWVGRTVGAMGPRHASGGLGRTPNPGLAVCAGQRTRARRHRAPKDGFTACPANPHRPTQQAATQSRFGFGFQPLTLPAAGGPPRVSAAPPHPTRSGSSRRCRRCRSNRSGSSPGTAGDSPRRSSTPVPGTRSRW